MFALIGDCLGLTFVLEFAIELEGLEEAGELAADVADDELLGLPALNFHHRTELDLLLFEIGASQLNLSHSN